MAIIYVPDLRSPMPRGVLRTENPFSWMRKTRILRQRFYQDADYFAELPINTPFTDVVGSTSPGITGNWTLRDYGVSTAAIAPKASAATVEAALRALANIGADQSVLVGVSGNFDDGYSAEFQLNAAHPHGLRHLLSGSSTMNPAYSVKVTMAFPGNHKTGKGPIHSIRLIPIDSTGESSTPVLVEETARQDLGNGLVEWDRVYANIPEPYLEHPPYNYQMQRMQTYRVLWNSYVDFWGQRHDQYINFIRLSEYSEPLIATIAYNFCLSKKVGTKNHPLYIPYRIIHYTDSFGQEYVYSVGTYGVAEGSDVTQWMGDIQRIRNVLVSPY